MLQTNDDLLRIEGLRTVFRTHGGDIAAVDGVDLSVPRGRTLGIVGESGCGKSVLSLSVMRLVGHPGRVAAGRVLLEGRDLLALSNAQMRDVRGSEVAMIFQEPMTSLNPVHSVGFQITEAMRAHDPRASNAELRDRAIEALTRVRIPAPERRFEEYPHQLSGGMRQRVGLARALAADTDIILMDEAFSALDPLIRAEMQDQLLELQKTLHKTIVFITHDLDEAVRIGNRIAILKDGRLIQVGTPKEILHSPADEYVDRFVQRRAAVV
jgi:peptide/nickel transport system ATP-binding protein/oligopeptide transport system ATP-binding protein